MAYQNNFNKVADDFAGLIRRRPQEKPAQPKTIDCKEAAKRYGGVLEVAGRRPAVQPKHGSVPQGGILIMDYSKRKSKLMAY